MGGDVGYAFAYGLSAMGAAVLATLIWPRRAHATLVWALVVYLAANALWSMGAFVQVLIASFSPHHLMMMILPAVSVVVAAAFFLARGLSDRTWRPRRRVLGLLALHPVIMVVASVTGPLHGAILSPGPDGNLEYAWFFWVHTAYSYTLLAVAVLGVLRAQRHAPALHARQQRVFVAACAFPLVGNVITLVVIGPEGHDLTPVFFLATAVVVYYAVFRKGLIDLVPVARNFVLELLGDAVIVLDEATRVADLNAAARRLLAGTGVMPRDAIGGPARAALGPLAPALLDGDGEYACQLADGRVVLDVRTTRMTDRAGRGIGRVLVARDITVEDQQRRLLEEAHASLSAHVQTIETLRAEVAEQAVRDALTGLHNRRHLDRVLPDLLGQVADRGADLSLVMLDVDHFKAVNDVHGHTVGDQMLVAVGEALSRALAPTESLVRYGGEEFVLVLPGLVGQAALERAETLRQHACGASVSDLDIDARVTASAGVASAGAGRVSPNALLGAADAALYEAKAAGRDRSVLAPPPTGATDEVAAAGVTRPAPRTAQG